MSVRIEGWSDRDCPVCALPYAFAHRGQDETCPHCGWTDDAEALAAPGRGSRLNGVSLREARARWPAALRATLGRVPLSSFDVQQRAEGVEFVIDGMPLRSLFADAPTDPNREASLEMSRASSGRTALYVCSLCGDPDEVAVTADVAELEDRVVWSRIGQEEYDDENGGAKVHLLRGPLGFAFDARSYHATIARKRVAGAAARRAQASRVKPV